MHVECGAGQIDGLKPALGKGQLRAWPRLRIQTCKNTCKQPQSSQDEPGKAEGSRIRPAGGVEEVETGRAATAGSPSRATQNLSPLEDGSNLRRVQLRHWR